MPPFSLATYLTSIEGLIMIQYAMSTVVALLLFSFSPLVLQGQEIVLSEYYNIQDVTLEWTEIVIVKDDLNAVGWMITDANTGQVVRQGGPRFNDIPLWRHLRAGTIIVLWHRSLPVTVTLDTNAADGFMEMSARDVRFFTTNYFAPPSDLADMNIADGGDVLEILRADSSHVHALGHMKPAGPAYVAIGSPKVNFDSGNVGAGRSNRVTGRTLTAYGADITKDSAVGGFNDSRGLPNRFDLARTNAGVANINHWFWRDTREPQWSASPVVTIVSRTAQKHVIEWTPIVDTYQQDSTTGYVILRDTLNFASFPANGIRDGQMISKGARIGSALVLDVRPSATGNRYSDSLNLLCGGSYTYRVYGYRYRQDDQLSITDDTTARGRQYNELRFAQSALVTKPNPTKPSIQASRLEFCFGDTVALTTSVVADRYDWTLNGAPLAVGGTTRVIVREPGTYRLMITADGGCSAISDPITITTLPAIDVDISPRGVQTICSTDSVVLSTSTIAPTYEWLRDGVLIGGATNKSYTARTPGDYQVRIASAQGCPGISSLVKVRIPDVRFRFSPTSLDFGVLGQCKSDTTLTIELLNDGAVPVTLTSSSFPPGFALVFPAPGFVVPAGTRQTLRVLFTPATAGVSSGTATFTVLPCNQQSTFTVRGERTQVSAALDRAQVNYGIFSACPTSDIRTDSTFRITNAGTSAITVRVPRVDPPFYLLTSFPSNGLVVLPGEALPVKIQYRPLGADLDRGVIQQIAFPFTSIACSDTLRAQLQAASYAPRFTVDPTTIDVGIVLSCALTLDTVITVTNTTAVPLTVTNIVGTGLAMIGTPVVVAPQSSKSVSVQITPVSAGGAFTLSGQVQGQPCGLSAPFTVDGQVIAPTYQLEKSAVDFGQSSLCGSVQSITVPVYVVAKGLSGLRSRVEDFTISAPFTTDLVLRSTLTDTLRFNVTFNPTTVGTYSGVLTMSLGPCLNALTLTLSAEVLASGR
ncbi:MAG: choice-of-anchor D domain-containing protein, partial [Candidatus Kapabacteria bacterium]|nr:choice-of-anchor D domain-containing protein [Candidatus Kapabacteria bacterium]